MNNLHAVHNLFENQAIKTPHHLAIISNKESLTYAQLNHKANQLAHYLISVGLGSGSLIAIHLERSIDFVVAVLGILKSGAAYIPLDITHPAERIALILEGADNPLLITTKNLAKTFSAKGLEVLILSHNKSIANQPSHNPGLLTLESDLAYVIYTSGSTGVPKGVLIEHGAIINYAQWFATHCNKLSKVDFSANPAFDFAVTLYLIPLMLGTSTVICRDSVKKDPQLYLNHLKENAIDFIKLTPSYFKILLEQVKNQPIQLSSLKHIMLGGENLLKTECESWLSLFPNHILYNEYGPTETTVAVTVCIIDKNNIKDMGDSIPIGTLALNTYAYLLNKELKPVAPGDVGELYLGGTCLARGYLNNPEANQNSFISDPFSINKSLRLYKTGDLCRLIAENHFECIGRTDHQVKIRGFRVELSEIEKYLSVHPKLKMIAVIAFAQDQKEKKLIAYYILKNPKTKLVNKDLRDYLRQYLPEYMIPSAFIRMESFPLNPNDKLDRAALPIPQYSTNQHYVAARNSLEKQIAFIWSEEFGISPIGIKDDFFELGGHSLSAARIISKINHHYKIELTLSDLYTHTTIYSLKSVISKAKKTGLKNSISSISSKKARTLFPLSDFQFMLWISHTFEPKAKKLNIVTRKRVKGKLDLKKLNNAFQRVIEKHEVLSYQVSKFRPGQYLTKQSIFNIVDENLENAANVENRLEQSLDELIELEWSKKALKIGIRLFYLDNETSEIQLCLSHIISDDLSPDILLSDLSHFYNSEDNLVQLPDASYRNYLLEEQHSIKKHLHRDIDFWEDYLKEASLYSFPAEYVIKDMQSTQYTYSTYTKISEQNFKDLSLYCAKNHISILDGLCSIVALALKNISSENKSTTFCINKVKSTRETQSYDNTVGCFLRIEPIKLALTESSTLMQISQDIHKENISTSPYQGCPNLIKLANINTFRQDSKLIKTMMSKTFFWLYSMIFQMQFYYETLKVLSRLTALKETQFLININVQNRFLNPFLKENEAHSFGFKEERIPTYHYDLLQINNVFDVNFMRDFDSKNLHLVISANLAPSYRQRVGDEMIRIMGEELPLRIEEEANA